MTYSISRFCRIKVDSSKSECVHIQTDSMNETLKNDLMDLYKYTAMEYPKFFKMDQLSKYGILAMEFMCKGYDFKAKYGENEIGIILSNASGSLDTDVEFQKTINNKETFFPSPAIFVYTLSNIVMGEICIKYKIKGENMFFLSETLQSDLLESYVSDLFDKKSIRSAIVGWVDCTQGNPNVLLMFVEQSQQTEIHASAFSSKQIELLYQ
jgi:hypothetical protein